MHDDVVDDSMERRGFLSVYALWKAKATVLIGDYLFAKGLLLSLDHCDYRVLHILSDAVRKMRVKANCCNWRRARNLNLDEDIYYDIIRNKNGLSRSFQLAQLVRGQPPTMMTLLKK